MEPVNCWLNSWPDRSRTSSDKRDERLANADDKLSCIPQLPRRSSWRFVITEMKVGIVPVMSFLLMSSSCRLVNVDRELQPPRDPVMPVLGKYSSSRAGSVHVKLSDWPK
eukprot:scaffold68346_cov47-Prasinocladus_malaysianus.AAC.3